MSARAEQIRMLTEAINGLLRGEKCDPVPHCESVKDLQELCEAIQKLIASFGDAQGFLKALSEGDLDFDPPPRNNLIAPFKQFHSNLRHLTWQAKQIAAGDFHQSVDFLGDFSVAFNSMIAALKDRKHLEDALRESEQQFRSLVELSPEAICIHSNFEIIFLNRAGVRIHGANDLAELRGKSILDRIHPDYKELVQRRVKKIYDDHEMTLPIAEIKIMRLDGTLLDVEVSSAYFPYRGEPAAQTLIRDISVRKQTEGQLRYLATHDMMTGLYNRDFFNTELTRLGRGRSYPISIIVADMDGLKTVNDTLGHSTGDRLIIQGAKTIQQGIRTDDILARTGGDEFSIILPETDATMAEKVVGRIRDCEAAVNCARKELQVSFSLGVATAPQRGILLEDLLIEADRRMYDEKARRKALAGYGNDA